MAGLIVARLAFALAIHWSVWTFKNTGSHAWPKGVELVETEGQGLMTKCDVLVEPVLPGKTGKITAQFTSPMDLGNHESQF